MLRRLIVVKAAFDAEAQVWFVEESDLPGLNAEGATLDELRDKLPDMIRDLFEENGFAQDVDEVPLELIAHASSRVRLRAIA